MSSRHLAHLQSAAISIYVSVPSKFICFVGSRCKGDGMETSSNNRYERNFGQTHQEEIEPTQS
jgi:hypothetical protein